MDRRLRYLIRLLALTALVLGLSTRVAVAELKVAVSIAPLHSLVARIMQGAGAPQLLLRPGASPHDYAMRPSEAAALARARVIFWLGPDMEGFLVRPLQALSTDANTVALAAVPGLLRLPARDRDGRRPAPDDSGRGHRVDPHMWLDPVNARLWLTVIAETLGQAEPARAAHYRANAAAAALELRRLETEIDARLTPLRQRPFLVFHDAYQYFESRFRLPAAGAVTVSDGRRPGPRQVSRIRRRIRQAKVVCIFAEPQFEPKLIATIVEGSRVRRGSLDPIGAALEPGPALYAKLLRNLAAALTDCLSPETE